MSSSGRLGKRCSVLAMITHYKREQWLAQCIESLVNQSRPPDGIVVIDDCSPETPCDIVRAYPKVTLLVAQNNVGMFALMQQVIASTGYDAYMFQDADDWSSPDRLELLLEEAERTNADMVGCQEERTYEGVLPRDPFTYPADCNAACLTHGRRYPILMGTSVLSRSLVERLGGFSSGWRCSADEDFVRRAVFAGKIVNIQQYCYHRRIHPNALTARPDTGMQSPLRQEISTRIVDRWGSNCAKVVNGQQPDLSPITLRAPVALKHVCGPQLRPAATLFGSTGSTELSPLELELARLRIQMGLDLLRARSEAATALKEAATALKEAATALKEQLRATAEASLALEEQRQLLSIERMRGIIFENVPAGARVAVVSKGDPALLSLGRRTGLHFPQEPDGSYAGYHPATSEEAIGALEEVRRRGADYLVFPRTSLWWLDSYDGFRQHLDADYRRVWSGEDCVIYRLAAEDGR